MVNASNAIWLGQCLEKKSIKWERIHKWIIFLWLRFDYGLYLYRYEVITSTPPLLWFSDRHTCILLFMQNFENCGNLTHGFLRIKVDGGGWSYYSITVRDDLWNVQTIIWGFCFRYFVTLPSTTSINVKKNAFFNLFLSFFALEMDKNVNSKNTQKVNFYRKNDRF